MSRGCKSFEELDRKPYNALKRLLVEIWILKAILVKAWKEERRAIENREHILENISFIVNRMLLEI